MLVESCLGFGKEIRFEIEESEGGRGWAQVEPHRGGLASGKASSSLAGLWA